MTYSFAFRRPLPCRQVYGWRLSVLLVMMFLVVRVAPAYAAELSLYGPVSARGDQIRVKLTGEILPGDAEKLASFLIGNRAFEVALDSPGGDVMEAIRIGEIIAALRLTTSVRNGAVCASSCFFVWIAGANRSAAGSSKSPVFGLVGLHRPFLKYPGNSESSLAMQASLVRGITAHLEAKLVPRRLIDLMMSRPSNDIYWMTYDDIYEFGDARPDLEELYIAKCKYDRRQIDQITDAKSKGNSRLVTELEALQHEALRCQVELDGDAHDAAMKKLKDGWRPPNPFQTQTKQQKPQTDNSELRKVSQAHPGWEKLVTTGAFKRWKSAQPMSIQGLRESEKASDVIRMLDLYKRDLKDGK